MNSRIKLFLFHILIPFLIGGLLYISFRSKSIRLFSWCETIGLSNYISIIRSIINPFKESIPNWVYYSLPDGLWMYSFTSVFLLIWKDQIDEGKYWLLIPLISGCFVEIGQGLKLLKGTFDPIDLILSLLAFIFSIIIINPVSQKNEKKISQIY